MGCLMRLGSCHGVFCVLWGGHGSVNGTSFVPWDGVCAVGRRMGRSSRRFPSHGTCNGSVYGATLVPWDDPLDISRVMGQARRRAMHQPVGRFACHGLGHGPAHKSAHAMRPPMARPIARYSSHGTYHGSAMGRSSCHGACHRTAQRMSCVPWDIP